MIERWRSRPGRARDPASALDTAQLPRLAGGIAVAGVVAFASVAVLLHLLRADVDGWHAPLSTYLVGDHGAWLRAVYYTLAAALVVLGLGLHRGLHPAARAWPPALLFACGGVALAATAYWPGGSEADAHERLLHNRAALTTFVAIGVAMLWQSWRLRREPRAGAAHPGWLLLAAAAFAALWWHALWPGLPRGASQKLVIVLYLGWLGAIGLWLWRAPRGNVSHDDESVTVAGPIGTPASRSASAMPER